MSDSAVDQAQEAIDTVADGAQKLVNASFDLGQDAITGILHSVLDVIATLTSQAKELAEKVAS